jgi:hypothetical protein
VREKVSRWKEKDVVEFGLELPKAGGSSLYDRRNDQGPWGR